MGIGGRRKLGLGVRHTGHNESIQGGGKDSDMDTAQAIIRNLVLSIRQERLE